MPSAPFTVTEQPGFCVTNLALPLPTCGLRPGPQSWLIVHSPPAGRTGPLSTWPGQCKAISTPGTLSRLPPREEVEARSLGLGDRDLPVSKERGRRGAPGA